MIETTSAVDTVVLPVPDRYVPALLEPTGWTEIYPNHRLRNAVFLAKAVPDSNEEIRLIKWDKTDTAATETLYAVEIGYSQMAETSFALGRGVGAPVLAPIFDLAFTSLNRNGADLKCAEFPQRVT